MIKAKCVSAGDNHNKELEGKAFIIYSSVGDPLVLIIETAPTLSQVYTPNDGDKFIEMVRRYEPRADFSISDLKV